MADIIQFSARDRHGGDPAPVVYRIDEADRLCDRVALFRRSLIRVDTPHALKQSLYGTTVLVQLAALEETVLDRVRRLPYVDRVESVSRREGALRISLENPERDNPQLVRALVEAGAAIQSLEPERHSLEEVYLDLVTQEPPP